MSRLGEILAASRGEASIAAYARRLGYSYTFVRAIQKGSRLPSDGVLEDIAGKLGLEPNTLILATYCDRSQVLAEALRGLGIDVDELVTATVKTPRPPESESKHDVAAEERAIERNGAAEPRTGEAGF